MKTTLTLDYGRKTLDAENRLANGYGYVDSGPGTTIPDGLLLDSEPIPRTRFGRRRSPKPALPPLPGQSSTSDRLGRWLRGLIGVNEDLLDRVREERAHYTCLGAIVLGTAAMATLSMLDAMDQVFGPVWPGIIAIALFWGVFICGIDRWLIARTHGVHSGRWRVFIPRIVLALFFGMIIATPLVLTVFGSAVVSQAHDDQRNAAVKYESLLKRCNPLPSAGAQAQAAAQSAACADSRLQVGDPAIGTDQAIAFETGQRNNLNRIIASDNQQISSLNTTAREECNGDSGPGLSAIRGQGPNCNRDRRQADNFQATSDVAKLQSRVTNLDKEIVSQTTTAGQQTQAYANSITSAITRQVKQKTDNQGRIGLLNRVDALGELAASHFVVAVATVLLGIFIMAVDCLPVLSKMMSGTTKYDEILEIRLRSAGKIAAKAEEAREREEISRYEIALHRIEKRTQTQHDQVDETSRMEKATRDVELDRRIAELAVEYRGSVN